MWRYLRRSESESDRSEGLRNGGSGPLKNAAARLQSVGRTREHGGFVKEDRWIAEANSNGHVASEFPLVQPHLYDAYDFSSAVRNPYAMHLKEQLPPRLDAETVAYFQDLAHDMSLLYQTLINMYLREFEDKRRPPH